MIIRDLAPCPQLANNDADAVRVHVQPSVTDYAVTVDSSLNVDTDVVELRTDSDVSM